MLDVTEALMVEQLGGVSNVALFVERFNALPPGLAPAGADDDQDDEYQDEPSWDTWGMDDDAQARQQAAMAMMGGPRE